MDLKFYIEKGVAATGSLQALAKHIEVKRENLSAANAGRRPLPVVACGKLADLINVPRWDVVAASEWITEKDEKKRAYLLPFVTRTAINAALAVSLFVSTPPESQAKSMTCEGDNSQSDNYAQSRRRRSISRLARRLRDMIANALPLSDSPA